MVSPVIPMGSGRAGADALARAAVAQGPSRSCRQGHGEADALGGAETGSADPPRAAVHRPAGLPAHDAAGRGRAPGWELMAPSRSPYIGVMGEDGSRSEFVVILGPRSYLLAVCFGRVAVKGSPEELAAFSIDAIETMGAARCTFTPN